MPEGHSIHRLAKHFAESFLGLPVQASSPQGRFREGAALLNGATPIKSEAYGKHFFLFFNNERILNVHLGMYGAWNFGGRITSSIGAPRVVGETEREQLPAVSTTTGTSEKVRQVGSELAVDDEGFVIPDPPKDTVRVRLVNRHGWADLIGASTCRILNADEAATVMRSVGPDPLRDDADPERFYSAVAKTRRRIGSVLMDQKLIGGIGNIYRAEGLFRAGLDPHTPSNKLSVEMAQYLWEDQVALMRVGVETGKIITTRPQHRNDIPLEQAWPEQANYAYQRHGQQCLVCGKHTIVMEMLEGRKLYWCTTCQR